MDTGESAFVGYLTKNSLENISDCFFVKSTRFTGPEPVDKNLPGRQKNGPFPPFS